MISRYPSAGTVHVGRGIGSYAKQLARAMVRQGAGVIILADRTDAGDSEYREDGVFVRRVWSEGLGAIAEISEALPHHPCSVIHLQHELFAFGRGAAAWIPGSVVKRARHFAPVATTIHGVIPTGAFDVQFTRSYAGNWPPWVIRAAYQIAMRRVINGSSLVITHNDAILDSARSYARTNAEAVIPHGVADDVLTVPRQEGLRLLGLKEAKRVVFLGFLLPYKGLDTLEEAAPSLIESGIEVMIAGGTSGDSKPTHKPVAQSPASGTRRIGFVPEHLLPALFSVTDVLVLPHRVGLSMSGPLSLAASYGVPIVISDVPSLSNTVRCPEATFRAGDASDLARTVKRVMNDSMVQERVRLRLAALKAEASWPAVAEKHIATFRRLVEERHHDNRRNFNQSQQTLTGTKVV